ncbi:MAG: cation:proton antiporter [Thermodesulfovibrionales bacterium]|nr:cation:proton antiporter [Thermodesulfovibrionales bacterium]
MQEYEILRLLVLIFGVSALVVFLLYRLRIPSLVGFLIAGVLIGPHGLGLVKDVRDVELLAEIGVILLLFVIGIEFSLSNLLRMKKAVIGGGGTQVILTIILSAIIAYPLVGLANKSIFFGFLIALSSTAIVLKMLSERGEIDTPHGRIMVSILIFQDLCVVPLMLITPAMGGEGINLSKLMIKMAKAGLIVVVVLLAARWIVPGLLHQVIRTKSRELFITTIILLCLGIALLTSKFGLSLALGAFLAGLVIAESEYAHRATSEILPFKDSFIGLFFVSVGMLMDVGYITDNWLKVTIAVTMIFCLKVITGMLSAIVIGSPFRTALHTGLGLAQIGEFSFVLAVAGKAAGLITDEFYQIFLSSSLVTMMMTPFIIKSAPDVSGRITSWSLLKRLGRIRKISEEAFPEKKSGHVVIVGFGVNGSNLARVLRKSEIPYVVLELNSDTVRKMKRKGEPIYYGDGTSVEILHKLGIQRAKVFVIAISDAAATRMIVQIARKENPDLYIIVRTRYVAEVEDLKKLGANEVIPEEFETSVEIFSRVLHYYHVPRNIITEHIDDIRKDSYKVLRTIRLPVKHLVERHEFLKDIETETYLIKEDSSVSGYSIKDLRFRTETGVTIIAIQRGDEIYQNPPPEFILKSGDIILLIGKRKNINEAISYLESDRFLKAKYHR